MTRLKATAAGAGMMVLVAGCAPAAAASPGGVVTGRFVIEGGPIGPGGQQPGPRPIPGTIKFRAAGRVATVRAGRSGSFSLRLPAGTYHVQGRSPRVIEVSRGTRRQAPCSHQVSVTVTPRHTTRITLVCIVP